MRLQMVELVAFRSWKQLTVGFEDRVTVLTGGNGTGKTTVLEAVWYLASLGSHRTSSDVSLVQQGETAAVVRGDVVRAGRSERIELEVVTKGRARTRLGGAPVTRRRDVLGTLRAQIFAPERMAVIRGEPGDRRRFVDELLVQLAPRYHAVIKEYERVVRQRNALLKDAQGSGRTPAGLEAWTESLIGPGAELAHGRARALARLAPHAAAAFEAVGGGDSFTVGYVPNVPAPADPDGGADAWATEMRARLEERQRDELIRGTTLVGPHRDEVAITIDGMPARTHASHGESWLSAMALVLGAHRALAETIAEEPVLLLDDPFTLLDPERRLRLVSALPTEAQIIITAADASEVPPELGGDRFDVERARA